MDDLKFVFRQLLKNPGFTAVPWSPNEPVRIFNDCSRRVARE
jgi:hypothetical protein